MKRSGKQPKRLRERKDRQLSKYAEKGGPFKYMHATTHEERNEPRGPHPRGVSRGSGARPFQGRGNVR